MPLKQIGQLSRGLVVFFYKLWSEVDVIGESFKSLKIRMRCTQRTLQTYQRHTGGGGGEIQVVIQNRSCLYQTQCKYMLAYSRSCGGHAIV